MGALRCHRPFDFFFIYILLLLSCFVEAGTAVTPLPGSALTCAGLQSPELRAVCLPPTADTPCTQARGGTVTPEEACLLACLLASLPPPLKPMRNHRKWRTFRKGTGRFLAHIRAKIIKFPGVCQSRAPAGCPMTQCKSRPVHLESARSQKTPPPSAASLPTRLSPVPLTDGL